MGYEPLDLSLANFTLSRLPPSRPFLWRRGSVPFHFQPWNPDQGLAYQPKILFGKNSYLTFALCRLIQDSLIAIVGRWPNIETPTKLANRDEPMLIVLVNVVCFFGGTVLPYEFWDALPVVSAMNRDYTATAALTGMLALIFQEPPVDVGSLACKDPERDGEPYRWFIPVGSPETGGTNQQLPWSFLGTHLDFSGYVLIFRAFLQLERTGSYSCPPTIRLEKRDSCDEMYSTNRCIPAWSPASIRTELPSIKQFREKMGSDPAFLKFNFLPHFATFSCKTLQ
jgi:hypothetical protein